MAIDITSANATAVLTVDELYPSGIKLEFFATDQSYAADEITVAETRMGVDGHMAAGYVPSIFPISFTFEAASPSIVPLNNLLKASKSNRRTYEVGLVITIPSINQVHKYSGGVLKSGKFIPDGKKVLEPQSYKFDFEDYEPSTI